MSIMTRTLFSLYCSIGQTRVYSLCMGTFCVCRYRPNRIEWPLNKPSQWLIIIKVLEQAVRSCRVWVRPLPLLAFDYVSIMECLCESLICKWIISIFRSRVCWVDFIPHNFHVARQVAATWEKTKAKQSRKRERVYIGGKKKEERATKSLKSRRVTISMLFPFFFCYSSFNLHSSLCVMSSTFVVVLQLSSSEKLWNETTTTTVAFTTPQYTHKFVSIFTFSSPFFFAPLSPHHCRRQATPSTQRTKRQQQLRKMFSETQPSRHSKWKNFSLCDFFFRVFFIS